MSLVDRLIYARRGPFRRIAKELLAVYGVEVPPEVEIGSGLRVVHRGFGTVIHPLTRIGNNVTIYHGVTTGRSDPWVPFDESDLIRIRIEDDVVLCAGAKIICSGHFLIVGKGAIIGANAVVTTNVPPGEIWAGVPARKVGTR